ncbi:hypothetical protein HYW84_03715 [Candidatus Peregrinibacteria bacterium]|nr:hypothetical protein [Candidatus Peregrinibacteria bacterium]
MQEIPFAWRVETLRDKHGLTLSDVPDGTFLTFNNARELVALSDDPYVVILSDQERTKLQPLIDYVNTISSPYTYG